MHQYQPIPFHILFTVDFQFMLAQTSIAEEEKVFERNDRFSKKTYVNIDN